MLETLTISHVLFTFLVVIFSIILHEVAHGYAAYIQGDETAFRAGRLTLNPLPHIDPIGSVIVPFLAFTMSGLFFGWAKPVPYNTLNVRTRLGQAFVSAAGVLTNLALAIIAGIVFKVLVLQGGMTEALASALFTVISVNISLFLFNLIPIPPFDGMAILQSLFPRLHIASTVVYNPVYLIVAIIVASSIFSVLAPMLFGVVTDILI